MKDFTSSTASRDTRRGKGNNSQLTTDELHKTPNRNRKNHLELEFLLAIIVVNFLLHPLIFLLPTQPQISFSKNNFCHFKEKY